jgi:hypothetical protein
VGLRPSAQLRADPRALHAELAENPELFVEIVSRLYKPDPEEEPGGATTADATGGDQHAKAAGADSASNDEMTAPTAVGDESEEPDAGAADAQGRPAAAIEQREAFFQTAWSVLHHWRRPPGTREDGTLDGEHLKQWVAKARGLFAERKRTRIGDSQLGELLGGVFPGEDGIWPAEPVRELVEELQSEPFDDGLFVGRMNSRGITTRGVYSDGSSEHQLAAGYAEDAAALEARWPRTAQILRRLQRNSERIADQEDEEAGRRADEG